MKNKSVYRHDSKQPTAEPCENTTYDACPVCASDEFMISETGHLLICFNCGPVNLNPHRALATTQIHSYRALH